MTATCEPQEMSWWADRCASCDHLLAAHRPVDDEGIECSLCAMQKQLEDAIQQQNVALRQYAEDLRDQAQQFATNLQEAAKQYIDDENSRFAGIAKGYVDALRQDATTAIQSNGQAISQLRQDATQAINGLSQTVAQNQTQAKGYVDQQIPLVIAAKVKPEALK